MGSRQKKIIIRTLEDFSGSFLMASPDLLDQNFMRAILLIVEHGHEGALGLIINRPIDLTLENVAPTMGAYCNASIKSNPIFYGGPVMPDSIWLLHDSKESGNFSKEIVPGIYFTARPDFLKSIIEKPRGNFRFFLGYSGWGEGQIENEVASGTWLLPELNPTKTVFSNNTLPIWNNAIKLMGINPDLFVGNNGAKIH